MCGEAITKSLSERSFLLSNMSSNTSSVISRIGPKTSSWASKSKSLTPLSAEDGLLDCCHTQLLHSSVGRVLLNLSAERLNLLTSSSSRNPVSLLHRSALAGEGVGGAWSIPEDLWKNEAKLFLLFLTLEDSMLDLSLRLVLLSLPLRNLGNKLLVLKDWRTRPKNPLALKLESEAVLQSSWEEMLPNRGPLGSSSGRKRPPDRGASRF